jgi:uncharacterized repeat protein (TIGR01451 family)
MNEKVSCQANSNVWQIAVIVFVSLLVLSGSAWAAPSAPSISLAKTNVVDNIAGTIHEGTILTNIYNITNTGNETISHIVIKDVRNYPTPGPNNVTIPPTGDLGDLAPGDYVETKDQYNATEADVCALGSLTDTATAQGEDLSGGYVTSTAQTATPVFLAARISVQESSTSHPLKYAHPGDEVIFEYTVQNPAYDPINFPDVTTIRNVVVNSSESGAVTLDKTVLAPGETATGISKMTVPADVSSITNRAYAEGYSCTGNKVTAMAKRTISVINPDMTIVVTSDKNSGKTNDTVTFTITVTNTGDIFLNDVVVVDTLPKGLAFVDDIGSDPKPVPNPPDVNADGTTTLRYSLPQILQSGNFTINIVARFNGDAFGKLRNSAEVNASDVSDTSIGPKIATKDVTA